MAASLLLSGEASGALVSMLWELEAGPEAEVGGLQALMRACSERQNLAWTRSAWTSSGAMRRKVEEVQA